MGFSGDEVCSFFTQFMTLCFGLNDMTQSAGFGGRLVSKEACLWWDDTEATLVTIDE